VETAGGLTESAYTPFVALDANTSYFWHVQAANACGAGSYSAVFSFTTRVLPSLLLVDDDDNGPDVRSYYTDVLDALEQVYDIWDTNNSDNEPDALTLSQYATVIWFSGLEFGGSAGPGPAGESALASFLDDGNCLFISSQDYYYDHGLTGFMSGYLGVAVANSDVSQLTVTGAGSVFDGKGPYTLSYPFANYSDQVLPRAGAEAAFIGNQGTAALNKETETYRTTFWGFPFEAVPSADRVDLMDTVLQWCSGVAPSPQPPALPPNPLHHVPKHRYLSVDTTGNPDHEVAVKVEIVSMKRCTLDPRRACIVDGDCKGVCDNDYDVTCTLDSQCGGGTCVDTAPCVEHSDVGLSWFVQAPEQNHDGCLPACGDEDWFARVDPVEHSEVWTLDTLHIGDCEIVPVITYAIYACWPQGGVCSTPLLVPTQLLPFNAPDSRANYGDVVGPVDDVTLEFAPPDGYVNASDIFGFLRTAQNYGTPDKPQVPPTWVDLHGLGLGNPPQYILNVSDLSQAMFGFLGLPWKNDSLNLQPGDCNP
jgi:hypothetical protein